MKNILLATLLGALTLFVWNAISWMVLELHNGGYKNVPTEVINQVDLKQLMPEAGVYHYPGIPDDGNMDAVIEQSKKGPVISLMSFQPNGVDPLSPTNFLFNFIFNLLTAGLAVYFLSNTNITAYGKKILFVALLGLFAVFAVELPFAVWYKLSAAFVIPNVIDLIVGPLLLGLVIGRFINKPSA